MIDQKDSIDLVVGIEEDQKAEIESHISTGAKVETENKIETQRRKKRGDLMIKKKSSVKSSSREKQSEDTNTDSKESHTKNEVNGTSEDIKSEGDTQSN